MSSKKRDVFLLILLLILLISVNYNLLNSFVIKTFSDEKEVIVERIVDGDTIVVENGTKVRMLGINTPEKGEKNYKEAKEFLEKEIINKSIKLKFGKDKFDKYNRSLAYVFLNEENINKKIVEEGFANIYFPSGKDTYYQEFNNAWKKCIENEKNICKKSKNKCADCIILKEFNFENQKIELYNNCSFECNINDWEIKDEGRKKFIFNSITIKKGKSVNIIAREGKDNSTTLFWKGEKYVWTESGDTLFLRDEEKNLVLWKEVRK